MGRIGPRLKDHEKLTSREREVLELVRLGLTNEEIAGRLGISANGVKYHVSEILSKLGVESREEAARWEPASERRWWRAVAPLTVAKAAGVAAAVAALVGLGVLAWGVIDDRGGSALDDAEAACAAGSTVRFEEAQERAWFEVYCPGFLPEGFGLDTLKDTAGGDKVPTGQTPEPNTGFLNALFADGSGGRIQFLEGNLGNDLFTLWRESPPPEPAEVRYGDAFDALLYPSYEAGEHGTQPAVVWAQDTGQPQYVIIAEGVDAETVRMVTEGMVRVSGEGTPSVTAVPTERPASPGDFPQGFLDFAVTMNDELASGGLGAGFFVDNTAYERWDCGGQAFPAGGQGCVLANEGGPSGVLGGAMESEGTVYDIVSYRQFISDWLTGFDADAFDAYGNAIPRVEAVADLRPDIERQDAGEEVYSIIATRIGPERSPPSTLPRREVLIFLAQDFGGLWQITGFTRAFPSFIDPEGDWPDYPDVSDLIIEWRLLVEPPLTAEPTSTYPPGIKPPDGLTPAAGICAGPPEGDVGELRITPVVAEPRCLRVLPSQRVRIVNGVESVVTFSLGSFEGELAPGGDLTSEQTAGEFLAPGVHSITISDVSSGGIGQLWVVSD